MVVEGSPGQPCGKGPAVGRSAAGRSGGGRVGRRRRGAPGGEAVASAGNPPVEPGQAQPRLSLDAGELGGADRPGELAVAAAMAGEQADPVAAVEVELGADDRADPRGASRLHEADGAVQAVAVAQPQRLDAQRGGGGHQGARRGGALEEGEVGTGGELREGRH